MGLLDYAAAPRQSVAYLFPEVGNISTATSGSALKAGGSGFTINSNSNTKRTADVFVFQFWPQQVQDNYTPNYATKNIPGASHPIFQWTSGNGRDISFTAQFVSELREDQGFTSGRTKNKSFLNRIQDSSATSITRASDTLGNAFNALLLPSSRYTVNVSAAIAALQQYLYPSYGVNSTGPTHPPSKLILVLPGTNLGRAKGADGVLCILRSASVTQEAFFPTGEIRAASVSLKFSEIIQFSSGSVSRIKYIGAESYAGLAAEYNTTLNPANELTLG